MISCNAQKLIIIKDEIQMAWILWERGEVGNVLGDI